MSGGILYKLRLKDGLGVTVGGDVLMFLGGFVVVVLVALLAATLGGRAYGRTTCANWSNETGIRTKFVILNWADSGTCLAQTPDGRWVLNSRWQAFVTGGKR